MCIYFSDKLQILKPIIKKLKLGLFKKIWRKLNFLVTTFLSEFFHLSKYPGTHILIQHKFTNCLHSYWPISDKNSDIHLI